MNKKPVAVTDAELAVLKVLWARGPLPGKACWPLNRDALRWNYFLGWSNHMRMAA